MKYKVTVTRTYVENHHIEVEAEDEEEAEKLASEQAPETVLGSGDLQEEEFDVDSLLTEQVS